MARARVRVNARLDGPEEFVQWRKPAVYSPNRSFRQRV